MFRMSKMIGLALIGFLLVVCTISAQPGKDEEKKQDKGKFGPGGAMRGARPQPGKIFNTFVIAQLKLTDDQKKQLEAMQKDVDEKLDKMLTDDQKAKLKEIATAPPRVGPGGNRPGAKKNPDDKKDEKKDEPKGEKKDEKKDN